MKQSLTTPDFSGEYFVPGKSGQRIEDDHMERYKFAAHYANGKSVLDIACGIGYSAPMLIDAGAASYDGADINQELTAYANNQYGSDSIRYHTGDICSFDNGRNYDLITCFETIEHVPDYESALLNLHKLLRQDGLLLISSPNRVITSPDCTSLSGKPANKYHIQEFTPGELLSTLRKFGFLAQSSDVFGQRQRLNWVRSIRHLAPKFTRKLERIADRRSSADPTPIRKFHDPRYFLVVATKRTL
jgi:2-polyprenyl-3-methyl-5-hydroxy-6-metoxy-1,4-benzoquinol methylase